jgi:hypothetical protein
MVFVMVPLMVVLVVEVRTWRDTINNWRNVAVTSGLVGRMEK